MSDLELANWKLKRGHCRIAVSIGDLELQRDEGVVQALAHIGLHGHTKLPLQVDKLCQE